MQRYLNTTHRSTVWFKKTSDADELLIQPPFQRNPVWSLRQKAALIDTILLEYPIPELYMQEITREDGSQKHVLVDGQQRIRAVLSFIANEFELQDESPHWAGLTFDDLSAEDRKKFYEYNFVVRVLPNVPEEELRGIFLRVNRNTTVLNAQELRHAIYWGPFIRLMEEIAENEFWDWARIFSSNDRRRMLDIEFISELSVAVLNGLQNKKKKLEEYYQQYETSFDQSSELRSIFAAVLGELGQILPDISKTRWKKRSDFYSLFLTLAAHYGELPLSSDKRSLAEKEIKSFGEAVDSFTSSSGPDNAYELVRDYTAAVERAASDLGSRRERARVLEEVLQSVFSQAKPAAFAEA